MKVFLEEIQKMLLVHVSAMTSNEMRDFTEFVFWADYCCSKAILLAHTHFNKWENGMSAAKYTVGKPRTVEIQEVKFEKGLTALLFKKNMDNEE